MKIQAIKLQSFKSYIGIELPTEAPRVFVTGRNNAGKTSIREAVRWVLTGKCQALDGRGSGTDLLAPYFGTVGSQAVEASVHVSPIGWVYRSAKELLVEGVQGDKSTSQAALYLKLRTSDAFLQACLDSSAFLALHHSEGKQLLLDLLNVRVRVEDVVYSLVELDAAYKTAFEDRKQAKRRLTQYPIPVKPEGEFPPIDKIDAVLAERRQELATLNQQIGETNGKRLAIRRRADEIASVSGMFHGTVPESDLPAAIADLEERLAIMEEAATDLVEPVTPAPVAPVAAGDLTATELSGRIVALEAFMPKKGCVLDPGGIECPVHRLKFKNRAADLTLKLDAVVEQAAKAVPSASQPHVSNPLTAVRKELDALRAMQASYVHATAQHAERQAELDRLTKELSHLPDTSAAETAITDLTQRIQKGEQIRRDADGHQKAIDRYQESLGTAKSLQVDVDRLEALCEVLGPSGARVGALAAALDPFLADINAFTGHFGWTVGMVVDPWGVLVNGRPVETYSRSEQYRIGIAIQLALAKASGLGFAIVDELDMLDATNRDLMARLLLAADLEQVIILGTREPSAPLPKLDGVLAYRLGMEDGRSQILERSPQ